MINLLQLIVVKISSNLSFSPEGYCVRWTSQTKMFVAPKFACCTATGFAFIEYQKDTIFVRDQLQSFEKFRGCFSSTFVLNWFYNDADYRRI